MHHKDKQAHIVMLASLQEPAQTQARMHHEYKHARNRNPLCGGSLEGCGCSRRQVLEVASFVPGQGSHTAVLDGSLFEKEQGGHTFGHGPHGAATFGGSNRSQRRRRPNTVHLSLMMEPMSCRLSKNQVSIVVKEFWSLITKKMMIGQNLRVVIIP